MLDLIGFWFNVSVITLLVAVIPLFFVGFFLVRHMLVKITNDERASYKTMSKVWDNWGDYHYFFNTKFDGYGDAIESKFKINEVILGVYVFCIAVGVIMLGIAYLEKDLEGLTLIGSVSGISEAFAPYTSGVAIFLAAYFGVIYVGRKVYLISEKVNKVMEKVNKHEALKKAED